MICRVYATLRVDADTVELAREALEDHLKVLEGDFFEMSPGESDVLLIQVEDIIAEEAKHRVSG